MGDFEVDTQLEPLGPRAAEGGAGRGRYRAHLSEDWRIWGPNGGYLAAIALRAVGREAAIQRPASFHGHFLRVGDFAEVEVRVDPVRLGRRSESYRVSILQAGKPLFEGMVRTAADGPGLEHDVVAPPEVAGPEALSNIEELLAAKHLEHDTFPFWQNLESRPLNPDRVGTTWEPEPPSWREWYRFRPRETFDEPFLDAGRSLLLIDTLTWPAACRPHAPDPAYNAPNLDVTVWFHQSAPDEPWLLADTESPHARGGLMGTHGRVYARDGRLLASGGAQLYCVPVS